VLHGIPLGFGIGAFFSLFRLYVHLGEHVLFGVFGLGLLPSLTIACTIRGSKRHLRFQLTNLAVWSSAMFVWSLVGGPSAEIEDLFIVSGWLALSSSLVGSTIILLRDIESRLHGIGRRVAAVFRRLVDDKPTWHKGPGQFMLMSRLARLRVKGGITST
jgi:hypothetical protein